MTRPGRPRPRLAAAGGDGPAPPNLAFGPEPTALPRAAGALAAPGGASPP